MKHFYKQKKRHFTVTVYSFVVIAFVAAVSFSVKNKNFLVTKNQAISVKVNETLTTPVTEKKSTDTEEANKKTEESKQAFLAAYKVFMHPRCMNCHPSGDVPLQGDDSHLHTQGVKRGMDGKGIYALKCKNCHQDTNIEGENMPPGHPNWHLPTASRKMVFEGKSPRQLALNFKDPKFTGFKSMELFIHHVEEDELVKHSFTYGVRPPLSHEEFVAKVKEWVQKGAALPDK